VYQVRYRARNLFGWSPSYSDAATIAAVAAPGLVPAAGVVLAKVGTNVRVTWSPPADNGSPLTRYELRFAESAAEGAAYTEESVHCDGSQQAILLAAECTIPMSQFWLATTASPFGYAQGEALVLQLRAWNAIGAGPYTSIEAGPTVETAPDAPTLAPQADAAATSPTQITVTMAEITSGSLAAGGAAISSYNLEWNGGSGTTFSEVVGDSTESLARSATLTAVTAGETYSFRYRVKNIHGWSAGYSPEVQIMAAAVPDAPAAPGTSLTGALVTVTWAAPAANGAALQSYVVELQGKAGGWHLETTDCDGADPAVQSATACTIPQSTLTDPAGAFQLERGDLVAARVSAVNQLGSSAPSPANAAGAHIQTLPAAPSGLASGPGTSASQIELSWAPLTTDAERGGVLGEVAILSYHVEWDAGSPTGPWAELVGLSAAYVATSYTTSPTDPAEALTAGSTYRFRVRAQNAQGWGPSSSVASILAAGVPAQMAAVTVADNAGLPSVRIAWAAPSTNGSPLTAVAVLILTATPGDYQAAAECDGTAALALGQQYCDVPMAALRAAPFGLSLGDGIVAVARAANSIGWSPLYSAPNSGLAVTVQQAPDAPSSSPTQLSAGAQALAVSMPLIGGALTGGSGVTSYNLQYDQGGPLGTGTAGAAADDDFISLVGEVPDTNTAQTALSLSGLVPNTVYAFRYRVKNKHGWSAFSPLLQVLTATVPAAMSPPTVSYSTSTPTSISVVWAAPYSGGSPVTAYAVRVQHGDDAAAYSPELSYCDGASTAVVALTRCEIPLTTLRAFPFDLARGALIRVKVAAVNTVGQGEFSDANDAGAAVQTEPGAPATAPTLLAYDESSITISVAPLTGAAAGDSPVLYYEVAWDQGLAQAEWTAYTVVSSSASAVEVRGLSSGATYAFKYRAQNLHGWSTGYSPVLTATAMRVPS